MKLGFYKYIAGLLVVAGILFFVLFFSFHRERITIDLTEAYIKDVRSMTQLCSMDIYNEVPVVDTINNRVMFAVQKQQGSISFDIEKLETKKEGEKMIITLPPEIVEIYESTEPNSWQVIDTKAIGPLSFLRSDNMPEDDERKLKLKIKNKAVRQLYLEGIVQKARKEAALNLASLMTKIYGGEIMVIDPTPRGAYYNRIIPPSKR